MSPGMITKSQKKTEKTYYIRKEQYSGLLAYQAVENLQLQMKSHTNCMNTKNLLTFSMEIMFDTGSIKTLDSVQKTEMKTFEESVKSLTFSLMPVLLLLPHSFHPIKSSEISAEIFFQKKDSLKSIVKQN